MLFRQISCCRWVIYYVVEWRVSYAVERQRIFGLNLAGGTDFFRWSCCKSINLMYSIKDTERINWIISAWIFSMDISVGCSGKTVVTSIESSRADSRVKARKVHLKCNSCYNHYINGSCLLSVVDGLLIVDYYLLQPSACTRSLPASWLLLFVSNQQEEDSLRAVWT